MSDPQQLSLDLGKPHRNHYLFSDHYLDELLRRERVWSEAQPQAVQFLTFLRQLYAREGRTLEAYSEAQLEDHWIKPILGALGHSFETQATVPGLDRGIKKPDYVFFADETARQNAAADQRSEAYARRALAGPVDGLSRLVGVYRQYAPRYSQLVERLARTDWLIDQIVYKFYGLTDEEIAIVEGKA